MVSEKERMEGIEKRSVEVPEESDADDMTSEDDWARNGQRESRGSLTFYTAARQAGPTTLNIVEQPMDHR